MPEMRAPAVDPRLHDDRWPRGWTWRLVRILSHETYVHFTEVRARQRPPVLGAARRQNYLGPSQENLGTQVPSPQKCV